MKLFMGYLLVLAACGSSSSLNTGGNPDAPGSIDASVGADGGTDANASPDASTVCTADTMNDASNCGICGRSCLGGTCSMGMCTTTQLNTSDVITNVGDFTTDGVFVYYSGFTTGTSANNRVWRHVIGANTASDYIGTVSSTTSISELAFDGSTNFYVAWTDSVNGGEVKKFNKTPFSESFVQQSLPTTNTAVFLQGSTVYWATDVLQGDAGDIKSSSTSGGSISTITANAGQVYYITGDTTNLYWVDNAGGGLQPHLRTAPIAGGATVEIAAGTADFVDMDTTYVYTMFKNTGDVVKVTKSNNSVATIAHSFTAGVAVDSTYVYGGKTNQLVGVDKTGNAVATLWVGAPEGTMACPVTLKIGRVKVIGNYVYFLVLPTDCNNVVQANRIMRTPRL